MNKIIVKAHKRRLKSGKTIGVRKYDRKSNKDSKKFIITLNLDKYLDKNGTSIHAIVYEYHGNYLPNRKFMSHDLNDPKVESKDYYFDNLDDMIKKIVHYENGRRQLMITISGKSKHYGFSKKELKYIESKI